MKAITAQINCLLRSVLLILALFEGIYGLGQFCGILSSANYRFPVTGTFYNPGPYACYLALTFPLALYEFVRGKSKCMQVLGAIVLAVDVIILPGSMSRTAWLAALSGSLVTFHEWPAKFIKHHALVAASIIMILFAVIGVGSYKVKQESADGRFLMWKVAYRAISPEPFYGTGWDCVAGRYGEAQERYFEEGNRSDQEVKVADAPQYVFNEYLQVAIAYGWGWSVVMMMLLAGAITVALINRNPAIVGCIVSAAMVMMASYPFQFQISVITIGVLLVTAFLSESTIVVGVIGTVFTIASYTAFRNSYKEYDNRRNFSIAHSLHQTGEWQRSNKILLDMLSHSSDPMPLNILGKNYKELGMPDSAEYYLIRSANRCPNRLYPHYLLMKLYSDSLSGDKDKAQAEAKIILTKKEKIPSSAIDEMRMEATKIIEKNTITK